jgi:hypothetical protein
MMDPAKLSALLKAMVSLPFGPLKGARVDQCQIAALPKDHTDAAMLALAEAAKLPTTETLVIALTANGRKIRGVVVME